MAFQVARSRRCYQRFAGRRDLHQADGALTPLVTRFNPQARTLVIPAHDVLIVGEIAIQLQQAEPFRVVIGIGVELQLLRVVQRTANPLTVTAPHRQPIGVVDLRVNGIAHAAFIIPQLNILVIGAMPNCLMSLRA